ncbi:fumarate hydratase [Candidatus Bathyarchaeota archaeon]|nr:fumarate hydratase [Candidatus Bathyarchaeota archaeon]
MAWLITNVLIEEVVVNLLRQSVTRLPGDVKTALKKAYNNEKNPIGKTHLKVILENIEMAEKTSTPMCQDTGIISFYLEAGSKFRDLHKIEDVIRKAVRRATKEIPLRPNAVDPFTQKNTADNIGRHIPYIHWKILKGNFLKITAFPKGCGSENMCALRMMTPRDGLKSVKEFIIDRVIEAGGMPCPPTIIGVGIGGGSNIAMELAKQALLKPLDQMNPDERIARFERELCEDVNKTGIGPMGLGGDTTALAVKVEYAHRHPASYPVAVAFQCWAARRATAIIDEKGKIEYITNNL